MREFTKEERDVFIARMREKMNTMFGIQDTSGVDLFTMIRLLGHAAGSYESQQCGDTELSGARWRLMMYLLGDEVMGRKDGVTPTVLSRNQRVSKNTISALLRGLEEQGLIQRNLDPLDYRIFRIQLTQAGRDMVMSTAPKRIQALNDLASGLDATERDQLLALLDKLHKSILERVEKQKPEIFGG